MISLAELAPWTSDTCPPVARWVSDNQPALDTLRRAFDAPQFYLPRLLGTGNQPVAMNSLTSTPIDEMTAMREAFRCLNTRVMLRIGEGSLELAWLDAHALLHHATRDRSASLVIDELFSIALIQTALRSARLVLSSDIIQSHLAQRILNALMDVPPRSCMDRALDFGERMWALDMLQRLRPGRKFPSSWCDCGPLPRRIPWNLDQEQLMREATVMFDRAVAAARQPDQPNRTRLARILSVRVGGVLGGSVFRTAM